MILTPAMNAVVVVARAREAAVAVAVATATGRTCCRVWRADAPGGVGSRPS